MTLRHLLLGGAAAFLVATTGVPGGTGPATLVSPAMAATDASISISTFYDRLALDGDWVQFHGTAVFVPTNVADGWRPYTVGHWANTKKYGWLWVSDEPFGWATYHYGRWGYADEIGWYWVPGTRWAPAWVSWRRQKGHVVWAPLPPRRDSDDLVSIEVSYEDTPDYYWVAVPTRDFLDEDLSTVVVRDDRERVRIVEEAQPIGEVRVQNNIVINNFIQADVIQQETGRRVTTVEVTQARSPDQAGKLKGDTIEIYDANVTAAADAKPQKLKDIAEVSQIQTNRKIKPTQKAVEPVAGQPAGVTPKAGETPAPADTTTDADKLKPKDQPAAADQAPQPEPATTPKPKAKDQPAAADQAAQPEPAVTPKKAKPKDQPAAAEAVTQPEPATPKKAKQKDQPAAADEMTQPEPAKTPKKAKPAAAEEAMQPEPASPKQPKVKEPQKQVQPEPAGEPAKPKKAPGKGCDPAAGAEC